jgi:hypothetical protein
MTEILSLAQAHSTRHFVLYNTEDETQQSVRVLVRSARAIGHLLSVTNMSTKQLWLFQPNMSLAHGLASGCSTVSQVAKIMYRVPDSTVQE